jgi:hypothetical protein
MQRQQSDITSYFKVKRKEPDSPAVEDPQPAKKPKLFLTLSDSSEEEARPILPKKSKVKPKQTCTLTLEARRGGYSRNGRPYSLEEATGEQRRRN